MMSNEVFSDIWVVLLEHIPAKRREDAAGDFVNTLLDHGIKETDLLDLKGSDELLDDAIDYAIDEDNIDDELDLL